MGKRWWWIFVTLPQRVSELPTSSWNVFLSSCYHKGGYITLIIWMFLQHVIYISMENQFGWKISSDNTSLIISAILNKRNKMSKHARVMRRFVKLFRRIFLEKITMARILAMMPILEIEIDTYPWRGWFD